MPNINLKDKNGNIVTYNGINKIQIQNASGGNALFVNASGAITITKNGSYDVTTYQNAIVNIEGASNLTTVAVPLAIEERTILPDGDFDGFSEIFVQGLEGSVNIVDSEGNEVEIESMEIDNGVVNILISGVTNEIDEFLEGEVTQMYNDRITKLGTCFANNYTIKSVNFPNVVSIGDRCFSGAAYLETTIFPKLKTIGSYSFHGTKITSDNTWFQTVDTLNGTNQFYSCGQLTKAIMPLITALPTACFAACNRIVTFYFPQITSIGSNCFQNCYSMTYLVLPQDMVVSLLNAAVFSGIHRVSGAQNNVYNPDGGINAFFYVNDNRLEEYKVATNWSTYVDNLKSVSELPQEIKDELGL